MASNIPIIKNINIKKYRRFQNFQGVTSDFNKYNIIYGWNYSGKTTLSRVFAFYNGITGNQNIDPDADFTLKTINGDLSIQDSDKIKVHTFNSDYIKNNLFFEKNATSNIIIVSDSATQTYNNLQKLKKDRMMLLNDLSTFEKQIENNDKIYDQKRSEYAKKIENFLINRKFTARNIPAVENNLDKNHLNDYLMQESEKQAKGNTLRNPTNFTKQETLNEFKEINVVNLLNLLKKTVTPSSVIQELKNQNAEEWVKNGIEINRNSKKCLFCGKDLDEGYLEYLDNIFKSEYDNLGKSLSDFEKSLKEYCTQIPTPADIINNYQDLYMILHKQFNDEIKKYNNKIKAVKKIIKAKCNSRDKLFSSKIYFNIDKINEIAKKLNDYITKHNKFIENEQEEKNKIQESLQNCIIAELLLDNDYIEAIGKKNKAEADFKNIKTKIEMIDKQIEEEEIKISDVKKGADEINKVLNILFMGNSNIELKVDKAVNKQDSKLGQIDVTRLYRKGGELADNLSDGERTAIAFSHFYTKIKDSVNNKTSKNEILFIDDPISSLDKNHIYSVSIMIQEMIDYFNQTFVTTHNYELYRLLKRKKENSTHYYYIRRKDNNISVIEELPKELKQFDSEYEYFFSILYQFCQNPAGDVDIYLIGHSARRFLDNYLEHKIPNNSNPCDKLKKFITDINENNTTYNILYKIVNDESHVHPEILFDKSYLINAVKLLLNVIDELYPDN